MVLFLCSLALVIRACSRAAEVILWFYLIRRAASEDLPRIAEFMPRSVKGVTRQ